jgi:hypothetical protein
VVAQASTPVETLLRHIKSSGRYATLPPGLERLMPMTPASTACQWIEDIWPIVVGKPVPLGTAANNANRALHMLINSCLA